MVTKKERIYRELLYRLEPRQQRFVVEYLIHQSATLAAKRAKYSAHTARQIGHENLTKPDIAEAVEAGMAMILERAEVDAERVVRELSAIAFSNLLHYLINDEGYIELEEDAPSEAIRAVQSVRRKKRVTTHNDGTETVSFESDYRLWDKIQALTLLGKKLKMWVDRFEEVNPQDEAYRLLLKQLREKEQAASN